MNPRPALDAYKFGPDRETYWLPRPAQVHQPTCFRRDYAQAGTIDEKCGCEAAEKVVAEHLEETRGKR